MICYTRGKVKNNHQLVAKAKFYKGFSDPARLSILESLSGGALTVSEIVKKTGLNQSNVSNHLACLKDCAIVACDQQGKYIYYELRDKRIKHFLEYPESNFPDILESVFNCSQVALKNEKNCGCQKGNKDE
jgi:DNA-binding transcriptional ArsR family regulator